MCRNARTRRRVRGESAGKLELGRNTDTKLVWETNNAIGIVYTAICYVQLAVSLYICCVQKEWDMKKTILIQFLFSLTIGKLDFGSFELDIKYIILNIRVNFVF